MLRYLVLILFFYILSVETDAQKRTYSTTRISTVPPKIDGIFNEEAWGNVEWSGNFIQREPFEKQPATEDTRFKILYDDNNLYIAIRCFDSAPDSIVRRMSRRDGFEGDWVEINIDSYHDLRTGFSFTINAAGVKGDEAITNDNNWDTSWDPIWYAKTTIDDTGWTAEIRIPFTQLRFGKQNEYIWGLQVNRRLFRKEELTSWQFVSPNATGWVHHFGELLNIKNIKPQKQKDIVPYTLGGFERYQKDAEDPFSDGKEWHKNVGVDGKIGITNDFTLDFTINPDFGQVEADPSEVNLTTFETKFDEKRNFFIEGKNILNFSITPGGGPLSNDNLFYSRRIGNPAAVSIDVDDDEYVKYPSKTTILGAFKLTGKTSKGWSVGVFESITDREIAEVDKNGERSNREVIPLTNYFAARVQKDLNNSNTRIGGMFTSTNRDLSDPFLSKQLPDAACTGGFDFNHQWKDKTYYFNFNIAYSHLSGNKEAIYELQTTSPHYFQREDGVHLKPDSAKTTLDGFGGNIHIGKSGNSNWMYTLWITWRSPGFNLNDIGYLYRTDEIQQVAWIGYSQREPKFIFRNYNINVNQWFATTFGGEKLYGGGNFNAHSTFKNYWGLGGGFTREGKIRSTQTLRGGPALVYDGTWYYFGHADTDHRKKIQLFANYDGYVRDGKTAHNNNYNLGVNLQLSNAFKVSLNAGLSKNYEENNYVNTLDDLEETRYVRGTLKQTTNSMTIRLSYNITPDFTIQYYGMPFISAGKYTEFKYITDPGADEFQQRFTLYADEQIRYNTTDELFEVDENLDNIIDYTFDQPNFNVFDFNSNLVIRWEYLPGSTVYLVWSQNRNHYQSDGDFHLRSDINTLFNRFPRDVFLIKLSYRFGL
ncbi:MAG: carbohydrate binding family 9 domain-containing protein [Bacteroidales bacterium]|nr:carbohydrate binding family 9 domain-containing protein [Bacteroidales bacterium]